MSRPTAISAEVLRDRLRVMLVDGRELTVPLSWCEWLAQADEAQRADLELVEGGEGIWWNGLDEGISVPALLGVPHI